MFRISSETLDNIVDLLDNLLGGDYYDDPNGGWGYECSFCASRTLDRDRRLSYNDHEEDCEILLLREKLLKEVTASIPTPPKLFSF